MRDLDEHLEAYRAQRLQGVEESNARTHLFAQISRERVPTDVAWGDIKARLDAIEDEIAEDDGPRPAA